MIKTLQRRFALSRQGAVDLIKGCIACVVQDMYKTVSCHILLPPVTGILFLQPRNRLLLFRQRKQTDSEENSVLFSSVS